MTASSAPQEFTDKQIQQAKGVIAIIACVILMIGSAFSYSFFRSSLDKAEYTTAKQMIGGEFRRTIDYQHAQTQSCSDFVMNKRDFEKLRLDGNTAWDRPWSMLASDGRVTLLYPLEGANDPAEVGQKLIAELAPTELEKLASGSMLSIRMVGTVVIAEYRCGRSK